MSATTTTSVTVELGQPEKSRVSAREESKRSCASGIVILHVMLLAVSGTALALSVLCWSRIGNVLVSTSAQSEAVHPPTSLLTGAGSWAPGTPMPDKRSDLQVVPCGGRLFILGGVNGSDVVMDTVWSYDYINEVYDATTHAPMPTPRYRFGAACLNSMIYVAGGFDSSAAGEIGASLATSDVYDVAQNVWSAGPPLAVARGDLALAAVGGTIHAFGGYDHNYAELASHEMLDPSATSPAWKDAAPMPHAKGDLQAATIGNKVYVPAGWNSSSTFLSENAIYDKSTDSWSFGAPMRAPRGDGAVVALHGKLFIIGGEMWSGKTSTCDWGWGPIECAVNLIPMHGVEMYDPDDDTWTSMSPLPASRFRFAAGAADERGAEGAIFAFGGHMHGEVAVNSQWGFHYVPRPNIYFHV